MRKQIIFLGVRQRVVDFDDMTVETYITSDKNHNRSSWPSIAAALLDIPPPPESLVYEERERHGLQLRYITVLDPAEERDHYRRTANLRVGAATIDAPFAIKNEIVKVIREAKTSILGPPKTDVASMNAEKKPTDSVMKYKAIAEGGRVRLYPLIEASLPFVTFDGEISSEAGFSIKTFYDQVKASYGRTTAIRALDTGIVIEAACGFTGQCQAASALVSPRPEAFGDCSQSQCGKEFFLANESREQGTCKHGEKSSKETVCLIS